MEPELLYRSVAALLAEMPGIGGNGTYRNEHYQWLGKAYALVETTGDMSDRVGMKVACDSIGQGMAHRARHLATILATLHRVMAVAEQQAPASARGSFVLTGQFFSAFEAVSKVLKEAKEPLNKPISAFDSGIPLSQRGEE